MEPEKSFAGGTMRTAVRAKEEIAYLYRRFPLVTL